MFMYYPEPNRAGSHGTSGVGVVIVLSDCYVSLIVCSSADNYAVGARVIFCGPRGVSHITQVGVDKAGFNQLLVPYQHPLLSPNHLFSSPPINMPRVDNTYVIPFEPVTISPFWPCFWPSSFFFLLSQQVHALLKVTLQEKQQKHHIRISP